MEKTFLAFDLGASSGRGILGTVGNGKLTLEEVHRFPNGPKEIDGSLFWDFDALFSEIRTGLKKAVSVCKNISGIAVDTWGVDYVLLQSNGKFARLPYQYRDSRTDGIPEEIFENFISQKELYARAGIQSMFFNTIYQLMAHKKAHPEDFEDAKLLFIPDAISYLLSGEITCEYTIASTSGLLNARTGDWDFEIIDKLGLPRDIFPEIVQPCTFAGSLKDEFMNEFNCGPIPIIRAGSHDTASEFGSFTAFSSVKF
jgi:rhamnulokinase